MNSSLSSMDRGTHLKIATNVRERLVGEQMVVDQMLANSRPASVRC